MSNTRDKIVEAADLVIYQRGFEYMSIADLADAVGISRGNVTFHFPTRDQVLVAVIDRRVDRTRGMLDVWERQGEGAAERIRRFFNILITNRAKILLYGCPVGTLCTELAKLDHPAQPQARQVFGLFREWLRQQFLRLGCATEADALAMHVLAWSQGVATLASAFGDEQFIRGEVRRLQAWLESLAPGQSTRKPIRRTKPTRPAAS